MQIYIIRHGETALNAKGLLQGITDEPLNRNGISLAAETGRNLRGITFDACISSPLTRARQTAEILLRESGNEGVPIEFDDRIMELNCGEMELSEPDTELHHEFFTNPLAFGGFPGGESIAQICERTQAFLSELIARDDGKIYLVSTHGCALRAMLNPLYDDPSDFWHGKAPYNCVINIVEANGGKAELIADDKVFYDPAKAVDLYPLRGK